MSIECNYSDLRSDADSLALAQCLKQSPKDPHVLSAAMRDYYSSLSEAKRYSAYQHDLGEDFSPSRLAAVIQEKMNGNLEGLPFALRKFYRDTTDEERKACCEALAYYLNRKIR